MMRTVDRLSTLLEKFGDRDVGRSPRYAAFPSERRPGWSHWFDRSSWDVVRDAVPLLLDDEPSADHPYLSSRWWEAHHENHVSVARAILVVLDAAETGTLKVKPKYESNRDSNGRQRTQVVGWTVEPLAFVDWAGTQTSIQPPEGMLSAALAKRGRVDPAVTRLGEKLAEPVPSSDDDHEPEDSDDEPVPLPSFTADQVRRAFVVFVALRCQGLPVQPGVKGARQLLGARDSDDLNGTVAKYLRDDTFANAYDEVMAWAARRDDRWPRIWAAFRSHWNIPAEIKGPR